MLLAAVFVNVNEFLNAIGGTAATMAIGIFLGQAGPVLAGAEEGTVREWATWVESSVYVSF